MCWVILKGLAAIVIISVLYFRDGNCVGDGTVDKDFANLLKNQSCNKDRSSVTFEQWKIRIATSPEYQEMVKRKRFVVQIDPDKPISQELSLLFGVIYCDERGFEWKIVFQMLGFGFLSYLEWFDPAGLIQQWLFPGPLCKNYQEYLKPLKKYVLITNIEFYMKHLSPKIKEQLEWENCLWEKFSNCYDDNECKTHLDKLTLKEVCKTLLLLQSSRGWREVLAMQCSIHAHHIDL